MKLCLISNYASHYREEIYRLMDSQLECDFVLGDTLNNGIKSFDVSDFRNNVTILKNIQNGEVTLWQRGVLKNLFKNYDIYIVADDIRCYSTWIFLILAKIFRKKVYFWAHGWYGRESFLKRFIKKIFYRFNDGIYLYGNYSKMIMVENGFSPDKLWVIHNSLSYSKQIEIRRSLKESNIYRNHFLNDDPTLIFIGRLTNSKKLDMIISAMKILQEKSRYCNLILVGDGEERPELMHVTEINGLSDRVWFFGACYDERVNAELIYNADLCVSPGNIGLTAVHVLTYGTPAITHDNFMYQGPEFEAIKPRVTGNFYNYGSLASLSDAIQEWLDFSVDNRSKIRQACYGEVDMYWTPEFQLNMIKEHIQ